YVDLDGNVPTWSEIKTGVNGEVSAIKSDVVDGFGTMKDGVVDFWNTKVYGVDYKIKHEPESNIGERTLIYNGKIEKEVHHTGGKIIVTEVSNGKICGISLNAPSVDVELFGKNFGKFGFEGTGIEISWDGDLSIEKSFGFELFSIGYNSSTELSIGSENIIQ